MLSINDTYILRKLQDLYLLVPCKKTPNGNNIIYLNMVGSYIYENSSKMKNVDDLVNSTVEFFQIWDQPEEVDSIKEFIKSLLMMEIIREE